MILAEPLNPIIAFFGFFSVSSIENTRSPVILVFRLVSATLTIFSDTPSSNVTVGENSVLKSSWIALPGFGWILAVMVPFVPPTRLIFTSSEDSSFIVYSEFSSSIIPTPPLLIT